MSQPQPRRTRTVIGWTLAHEQFPATRLADLGRIAEDNGFDAVAATDHFHPWQDNQGHSGLAWITLGIVGQHTSRLLLGTAVTCPTYRYHPAIVAEGFATLSLFYPGRVYLGVGTGEAVNEVPASGSWGHYHERRDRLAEAVRIIRQLWSGDWVDYRGTYYHVEHARLYDNPPRPIPIYIAAAGPQSAHLAGELGDGWITHGETLAKPEVRQAFEEGARAAGKDPSGLDIGIDHYAIVGGRDEAERWAQYWRFTGNRKLALDPSPVDIQRQAEQIPLEQVYGKWPVSDDPEVHVQAIQQLIDRGATHIDVHSPQGDQRRVIEWFGRHVLPRLKHGTQQGELTAAH